MTNKIDLVMFDWNGTLSSGLIARGIVSDAPVTELFEGVVETLRQLHEKGIFLGIATAASTREIAHELKVHNIAQYFTEIFTADHGPLKPHPFALIEAMNNTGVSPEKTLMVGDTSGDMMLAKNAGVRAVGVSYGLRSAKELENAGADVIIDNISDCIKLC